LRTGAEAGGKIPFKEARRELPAFFGINSNGEGNIQIG